MGAAAARVRRIELERHEQLDRIVAPRRKTEIAWHDSDNGGGLRINLNLFADDVAAATEGALPQAMRDERHSRPAVQILFSGEISTLRRLHSQGINQTAGDRRGSHTQRLAIGTYVQATRRPRTNRLPGFCFLLK